MKKLTKKQMTLLIVGVISLLILLVGGTYAYFSINTSASSNGANVTGSANNYGTPTIKTVTSNLYLNLNASLMSEDNAGITYFANSDSAGTALTENPNYTLAEVSLINGTNALDCTYNFKVTANVTKRITDGSDSDVKVVIGSKELTLKEIIDAGTDGVIVSGKIKSLVTGTNQVITLSSSVTNTADTQDNLVDNTYTITVEPYSNGDTKSFACKLIYQFSSEKSLAQNLIDSEWLWQSSLEGDGYRFTGSYNTLCSYDNGNYAYPADNQSTTPTCPTIYNYTETRILDGHTRNYTYQTSCPSDDDDYTYSCSELSPESMISPIIPNNFICFGTTDKDTCTRNPSTYMYRIIGVFADENGDNHVKLIKYTQLSTAYAWNADSETDIDWADSDLYKGLNGSYFLINQAYSYMQDNTWLNKITDWKWSAVNTKTYEDQINNPDYSESSPTGIYLSEMNKGSSSNTLCTNRYSTSVNCLGGSWTTPTAKIGLIYASDYALSLGSTALAMTTGTYTNESTLKTGWMDPSNNDTTASTGEWTISRVGAIGNTFNAWYVNSDVGRSRVTDPDGVRPVLYLKSDISGSGEGTLDNPYILDIN